MLKDGSILKLLILPYVRGRIENGEITLTRKFIDGVHSFKKIWPGSITVILEPETESLDDNIGYVKLAVTDLNFDVKVCDYYSSDLKSEIEEASVVLGSIGVRQNHLSKLCQMTSTPCVYVAENSFKNRCEILDYTVTNVVLRFRRKIWQYFQERKQIKAIKIADGLQCNGTPTYCDYKQLQKNIVLFFDSRLSQKVIPSEKEIINKYKELIALNRPIRLVFSGRLIDIKGTNDLPRIAHFLENKSINYEMFIFGDGDLMSEMKDYAKHFKLNKIKFFGAVDFDNELIPFISKNADIFLCTHKQSDPSCTYIETFGCGVPILGYENEAFTGIQDESDGGWVVAPKIESIGKEIIRLIGDPISIQEKAIKSRDFAINHTFEITIKNRVNQLLQLCQYN